MPPPPGPDLSPSEVHDVKAILQSNLKHEEGLKINQPFKVKRKKHRRLLDYILLMILGSLLFPWLAWWGDFNVVVSIYSFSGLILWSAGITWIMFQVMDDY